VLSVREGLNGSKDIGRKRKLIEQSSLVALGSAEDGREEVVESYQSSINKLEI
jgi:hypothetical protein